MNEARHADEPAQQTGPGLSIGEIYHVLFRHKWKVAVIWALTFVAAAAFVLTHPPSYKSEAKLLIRYVQETKSLTIHSPGNDPQILSPDSHGESIIHTETEILSSLDLAREVAAIVGPENLLGKGAKSNDLDRAALLISRNLLVQAPGKGNVIQMVFQHSDPKVIQPVLRNLMDGYRAKHVAIHQAVGILDEFLKEQTEKLRRQLLKTQQELAAVKNNAGIVSLEETKKSYAVQIAKIQDELLGLEADLAQRNSILTNAEKLLPQSDVAAAEIGAPLQKLEEYKRLCSQLDSLLNQERGLWKYTDQNPIVTSTREQIAYVRKLKKDMEAENPKLATLSVPTSVTNGSALFDLATERSKLTALQTKKNVLSSQLERIFASAGSGPRLGASVAPRNGGLLVGQVHAGSLAEKAGLKPADVLVAIAGISRAADHEWGRGHEGKHGFTQGANVPMWHHDASLSLTFRCAVQRVLDSDVLA